jgi:hypothetical protein
MRMLIGLIRLKEVSVASCYRYANEPSDFVGDFYAMWATISFERGMLSPRLT